VFLSTDVRVACEQVAAPLYRRVMRFPRNYPDIIRPCRSSVCGSHIALCRVVIARARVVCAFVLRGAYGRISILDVGYVCEQRTRGAFV
jgi:hypothetical protein